MKVEFTAEVVELKELKPHPRNYREHPEDQLTHIAESIRRHGFYRPIVTARELTILAGHGVALAAAQLGRRKVPIRRLPLDPDDPLALQVLAGDNEMSRLAAIDDRALTELLRELAERSDGDDGLLGTGFDREKLAALLMVTRTRDEIADFDAAAEWVGVPSFDSVVRSVMLVVHFRSEEDRTAFVEQAKLDVRKGSEQLRASETGPTTLTCWWPEREPEDTGAARWEEGDDA